MSENIRKDIQEKLQNGNFNCEKELTLSIISGKWKVESCDTVASWCGRASSF